MHRIANEVDAVFGGLIAQEQQPIFSGRFPSRGKKPMTCSAICITPACNS